MKTRIINFLSLFTIFALPFFILNNVKAMERRGAPDVSGGIKTSMENEPIEEYSLENEDAEVIENEKESENREDANSTSSNARIKSKGLENAIQRRSQVANAVSEMLKVADRNAGIGEQVRVMAQNQENNQEKIEAKLEKIQNRNKLVRFIFGPDNQEIKNARKLLQDNKDELTRLENVRSQLINVVDQEQVQEQIEKIKEASNQIEQDLNKSEKVFSLFGWVRNIFSE